MPPKTLDDVVDAIDKLSPKPTPQPYLGENVTITCHDIAAANAPAIDAPSTATVKGKPNAKRKI